MRLRLPETERKKFAQLYKKYYKLMIYVADGVLHSRAAAEDAAHTACMRILEHFSAVAAVDSPRTRSFVAILTRNVALTEYARAKRELAVEPPSGPDAAQSPEPLPADAAEKHDAASGAASARPFCSLNWVPPVFSECGMTPIEGGRGHLRSYDETGR